MPTTSHPDPAGRPASTTSHPAAGGTPTPRSATGSSVVALSPAGSGTARPAAPNTDESPTFITAANPPADPRFAVAPGTRLGHFEVIEAVGAGGMAAVLKARDFELGRIVALKILPPHMAREPENVVRFKQEARAAARLDHDNIARVFFCGDDAGQHFIAFEFVEGENLRVLIDRRGVLPAGDCVRYMVQVAAGLAHAAARGVVHRDVKPSNIVVSPDGKAKLVDMGLARSLGGQSVNGGVTQSGVTLGTFDYISPEQALDPRRADVRSDIYSLGCAFYHALTGRPPVPEGTAAKKLHAHRNEPVTDPRVLNPAVPDELAAVLAKMMAKEPARRYQSPAELIADLGVIAGRLNLPLDGLPGDPSGHHPAAGAGGSVVRFAADPPRVPLGLVAAVAGVAVAVAVFAGSSAGPSRSVAPLAGERPPPTTAKTPDPGGPGSKPGPKPEVPAGPPAPTPAAAAVAYPATPDELAEAFAAPGVGEIRLTRGKLYDLTTLGHGVVLDRSVTVTGAAGPDAPVIRLAVGSADDERVARPGTLTVRKADAVRFDGVRFELADSRGADDQPADPVGLLVTGVRRVDVDGCQFGTHDLGAAAATGLAVAGAKDGPPADLSVTHSFFDVRRAAGVRLTGRVAAKVAETGFAPHQAAIDLEPDPDAPAAGPHDLRLTHCTFLLDHRGAAVRAGPGARWGVSAGYCVFAAPPPDPDGTGMAVMMADMGDRRPAVLRVGEERPTGDATYAGRPGEPNAYYRVEALLAGAGGMARGYTFDDCRHLDPVPAADPAAAELTQSPWEAADPVKDLGRPDPWRALQLRTTFRRVQVPDADHVLLGARFVKPTRGTLRMYETWPPPAGTGAAANPREKVWWPGAGGRPRPNEFDTLDRAVAALRPGDTLLIRHDGPLTVPPVAIDRPRTPFTVRPHPESVGLVLVPPAGAKPDAGLFRLADGELTLEKLEFRGRAAVAVAGGRCTLRDCVVTLPDDPAGRPAAVVVPEAAAGPAGVGRRPGVVVENCLLRGRGAGVWVQAARPFDLEVKNTVAALAGPLLAVDPPARSHPADATAQVSFAQVTAVLGGPVLDLRPGRATADGAGWVPVEVTAGRCVFAPLDPSRPAPLVVVAPSADPPDPARYLKWSAVGRPNWYDRPADAPFLELLPADDRAGPLTEKAAGWFRFTKEREAATLGAVTFAAPPPTAADLTAVTAEKLLVAKGLPGADAGDAGADVRQVARPADEEPDGEP